MEDYYCTDCKKNTDVVFDRSAGDTICTECGLILESHSIDETSEWRTFANDDSGDNDNPDRVGGPTNMLLNYGGLSTVVKKDNGDFLATAVGRWQNRGTNPDRMLLLGFSTIRTMSDRLGLVATITGCANEMYKKVVDRKTRVGKNRDAILAACLYLACKQENKPRTINEICSVANGTTKKEISRAFSIVNQIIRETGQLLDTKTTHTDMKNIQADSFMSRFCSNLGMTNFKTVKAAQESCQKSKAFDFRRNPISIAAAVIYIVSQLSDDKKSFKDVSLATNVAEGTIRNSYKDMYPHLSKIIPAWYVQAEDLRNLTARIH